MTWIESIDVNGYAIVDPLIDSAAAAKLTHSLERYANGDAGVRNLLQIPAVRDVAGSDALRAYVEPILGRGARPVRGILFDKTAATNWKVAWHQDLSIAVATKISARYGPWSVKKGVVHVQPPLEVLEAMLTIRVNLDDCSVSNGPLRIIPGSHGDGVLNAAAIERWKHTGQAMPCTGASGSGVIIRPLILHASGTAVAPLRRRVVHIEYAAGELPGGVKWFDFMQ